MKLLCAAWVVVAACVDTGSGPNKKIDPSVVAGHVLKAAPATLVDHLDVDVGGGKLVYLGNVVEGAGAATTGWAPGGPVTIKHYWKVVQAPGPGWRVFAFVKGAPNTADFMAIGETEVESGHPVETWKPGEIVEDVETLQLRPDWKSRVATVFTGLIQTGMHTPNDRMAASGGHVVDRAIVARQLTVDLSKAPPPPGTVYVPRAGTAITIDGVANELAWSQAAASGDFVTGEGSPDAPNGSTQAKLTWDDQFLYLFVAVTDADVVSQYKNHDDPLWKEDAVEMFIDADGNKRGYVELQTNPNGVTFDSWFAGGRAPKGDEAWDSGMQVAVKLRAPTTSAPGDTDKGWDVEIAVPLAAVKGKDDAMAVNIPPHVGDRWKLNVVRVDKHTDAKAPTTISSWNRITYSDFHALDRMLTVVFANQDGTITPKAVPVVIPETPFEGGSGSGSGSGSANPNGANRAGSGSAVLAPPIPVIHNTIVAPVAPPPVAPPTQPKP